MFSATRIRHSRAFVRSIQNCRNARQNRIFTWAPVPRGQVIPRILFSSSSFPRLPLDRTGTGSSESVEPVVAADTTAQETCPEPPLTTSQRLSLLEKTVSSGHQEMRSMQKWVLAILFATFGAKFWFDSLEETKIRN
ncbi:hypothetical protein HOY80DRAFT_1023989 [Tuber brumale]|nr:hypothetical protein HOY80DRAFT_1023989 [Tuber brumale]